MIAPHKRIRLRRAQLRLQGVDADAVAADQQIASYKTVLKSV